MPTTIQSILESYNDNVVALALHLETITPDILARYPEQTTEEEEETFTESLDDAKDLIDDGDYLSLTDSEAGPLWDARLEEYSDDVILPELPEAYHRYFDREAWKNDAEVDWRGHSLAWYDGEENEQVYNGTTYYIYRNN